jgi:small subunit ribosomal protein S18
MFKVSSIVDDEMQKMLGVTHRLLQLAKRPMPFRPLATAVASPSNEVQTEEDQPIEMVHNPYSKAARKCLLCEHAIKLDYKNARLLQQFVSTFSGRVYERHITGLCEEQHSLLLRTIALSRRAGYMPILVKDPKYLRDPKLFDPLKPRMPHSFA